MRIAVLGATGLIGRHIVEALSAYGQDTILATFHRRPTYNCPRTEWVPCDLRQTDQVSMLLRSADGAVLCAGRLATSEVLKADPVTPILDTLRIVTNVLEAAADARLARVVMISSCTVYPALDRTAKEEDASVGDPPSHWFGVGWMHRYAEQQLKWYTSTLRRVGVGVVLRPTLVYGRHDDFSQQSGHFVPTMVAKIATRATPIEIWGDGHQSRNLLHATDLARAVLLSLRHDFGTYAVFNVAAPDDTTVNMVVRHLLDIEGFSDADIRYDLKRGTGPMSLAVSSAAFEIATGWRAEMHLQQGLMDVLNWYREVLLRPRA